MAIQSNIGLFGIPNGIGKFSSSFQLSNFFPSTYFTPSRLTMDVVRPRPDSDVTGVISYDHRGYVGIETVIKISVKGGAYPFVLENITMPTGATVGATVFDNDYLVIRYTPSANGTFSFSVDVVDQQMTRITRTWTMTVSETWVVFAGPAGNDTTGLGTKLMPYLTVAKAFEVTTGGKSLCLLNGTYGLTAGGLSMSSSGINSIFSETNRGATIDAATITTAFHGRHFYLNSPHCYIGGLRFTNPSTAGANPRWFSDESGTCSRVFMDNCYFNNNGRIGTDNNDNVSCFFLGGNASEALRRSYVTQTRCDFLGFVGVGNGWSSIDMYITENCVIEQNTFQSQVGSGTATAAVVWMKGAANKEVTIRRNEFLDYWSGNIIDMYVANTTLADNVTGNMEVSYNVIRGNDTASDAALVWCRGSQDGARLPLYMYRNTVVGRVVIHKRGYTVTFSSESDVIIHNHTNTDPHKIYVYDPNDGDNNYRPLSWMASLTSSVTNYELHLTSSTGVLDSALKLIGASRTSWLGRRGHEIYKP